MFDERITVAELEVSQGISTKSVYLQTKLLDNGSSGIKLVLTDGEDVWKGEMSENDLDKLCTRLKMDFKKFVSQSVSALTRENLEDITFEYHLKALPSNRMQLVWKKCVAADDIKFQLGHVHLEKVDSPSHLLCSILSQCVKAMSSLKKQIDCLETDNERLARDRTNAIKRLDKCVAAKTEVESDLYSKFMAILNSKKEKIRELEEEKQDGDMQVTVHTSSPVTQASKRDISKLSSTRTGRNGQISSSTKESASYTVDTDEESEESPPKQMRPAYKKNDIKLSESLNLGDDDDDVSAAPAARRAKRKVLPKKASVTKPILPKVTLTPTQDRPSTSGVGRRSSLRKSGSNSSKGSVNTEELFDAM